MSPLGARWVCGHCLDSGLFRVLDGETIELLDNLIDRHLEEAHPDKIQKEN